MFFFHSSKIEGPNYSLSLFGSFFIHIMYKNFFIHIMYYVYIYIYIYLYIYVHVYIYIHVYTSLRKCNTVILYFEKQEKMFWVQYLQLSMQLTFRIL